MAIVKLADGRLLVFSAVSLNAAEMAKLDALGDKEALRSQLRAWADDPAIERIVVSHRAPIEHPRETWLKLAV